MKKYLVLSLLLLSACAPERKEKDAVSLLNDHQYEKAIWEIENKHGTVPSDPELTFLLAQAYLGKAGIEPLGFAARVTGAQPAGSAPIQALFPDCNNGALSSVKDTDVKCLLKRIYLQAPDADQVDFARARELFRRAYPNPAQTPAWANTLIGMAETIAVVQRTGKIYLAALKYQRGELDPNDLFWAVKQLKLLALEASDALKRAQYSGDKISRLVSGLTGESLFDRVKGAARFKAESAVNKLLEKMPGGESSEDVRALLEGLAAEIN